MKRRFSLKKHISNSKRNLRDLNVVALGGGTGLSTLLRGLKEYVTRRRDDPANHQRPLSDLTAIVTVTDDGGSSGRLRREFDVLSFLRCETESRTCTIVYCTHIFDGLSGWPTHLLKVSLGRVMAFDSITEIERIQQRDGGSYNSALYEVCLAWLKEDKERRGRRGLENRKVWRDVDESVRGPLMEEGEKKSSVHTRIQRWKEIPAIKD